MARTMYIWFSNTIKGAATAAEVKGKNAIGILSYNHETVHPMTSGPTGEVGAKPQGQPKFGDFKITKYVDATSPLLAVACAGGQCFATVTVGVFIAQQADAASTPLQLMTYEMSNVLVTSIEVGSKGTDLPVETVALYFDKIVWTNNNMNNTTGAGKGNYSSTWNVKLNNDGK